MGLKETMIEDLEKIFLNENDFAMSVTLYGEDGLHHGVNASAIFDNGFSVIGEEKEILATNPSVIVNSQTIEENFSGANYLKNIKIKDKIWGCVDVRTSEDGTTLILLGDRVY